jgi:hypothetical protein
VKGILIDGVVYDDLFGLEEVDIVQNKPFRVPKKRTRKVTKILCHESVTTDDDVATDKDSTERILRKKKCGVHVMCDAGDGQLVQHNDLSTDVLWHASNHNVDSVGVEIIDPYYETYLPKDGPWSQVIDAPWAHKGRYVVPTLAQLTTWVRFVLAITNVCAGLLEIPRTWPGVRDGKMAMTRLSWLPKNKGKRQDVIRSTPGIWAHGYTEHSDGFFPVLFAWLVIEGGCDYEEALDKAVELATGARGSVRLE